MNKRMDITRDQALVLFGLLGQFVESVSKYFDAKNKLDDPLLVKVALYERLVEKTGPTNLKAITKHITAFSEWVQANRDACISGDLSGMSSSLQSIVYSENVFLPINDLFRRCSDDSDTTRVMWKHVLNIAFRLTGDLEFRKSLLGLCKQASTEVEPVKKEKVDEEEFVNKAVDKLMEEIKRSNPQNAKDAFKKVVRGEALDEIMDTLTEKDINMPRLMGAAMRKCGQLGGGDGAGMGTMMKMMQKFTGGGDVEDDQECTVEEVDDVDPFEEDD